MVRRCSPVGATAYVALGLCSPARCSSIPSFRIFRRNKRYSCFVLSLYVIFFCQDGSFFTLARKLSIPLLLYGSPGLLTLPLIPHPTAKRIHIDFQLLPTHAADFLLLSMHSTVYFRIDTSCSMISSKSPDYIVILSCSFYLLLCASSL